MRRTKTTGGYSKKQREKLMEDFLACYRNTLGVLTPAAEKAGVCRQTIWMWRQRYPEFDAACREIDEVAADFVESQLFQRIKDGSEVCTIFYLKTKCKRRGYVEKQEIDMSAEVKGVVVNVTSPESAQVLQDIIEKEQK